MATKRKLSAIPFKEWIWYLISALFIGWGIAEIICGLVLQFANVNIDNWPLYDANLKYIELFGLSFLHWGLILFSFGILLGVLVLCITAGKYDREAEKQNRRAARLNVEKPVQEEVVTAEAGK